MRLQWLVLLLLGGLAYGQAAAPPAPAPSNKPSQPSPAASASPAAPAPPSAPAPAPEIKVAPTDPVITLKGFCDDPAKQGDACRTVITREQFDKVVEALQPGMPQPMRRQLATNYARALMMSTVAAKKGLDKTPHFDQMMYFARMQILSQALTRNLQEEAGKVSDSDVEKYYKDNQPAYEQATVLRLFVPHSKQVTAPPPTVNKAGVKLTEKEKQAAMEAREKAGEAAMKKLADSLQPRAAKGEDFDKLEKEAYLAAGLKQTPPTTKMDKVRRNTLPQAHSVAFDLKPGEVSAVFSDPGGHTIYKMVSKQTLALDAVKTEIHNTIAGKRYSEGMQAYQSGANMDLSEAYFGPARNPTPAMPVPTKKGDKPPAEDNDPD
jgi:parvulin-like peptidyl-prolyl isomerase